MRFLVDQNRSPLLAELLRQSGHDAVYTEDIGLERAEDDEVLRLAREHDRIVVSGDADFGALLALARKAVSDPVPAAISSARKRASCSSRGASRHDRY